MRHVGHVGACALLALAGGHPALAHAADPGSPADAGRWKRVVFSLDAGVRLGHESNLHHVQRRHQDGFDTQTAQYQRFHRMEGPGDFETRIDLGLEWRFRHASKRDITLGFEATGHLYHDNEAARHAALALEAAFDLTRADTLELTIEHVPGRFRRNYRYEAFPGIAVYGRADETLTTSSLVHEHEWSGKVATRVGFAAGERDFDEPFGGRDERRRAWLLGVRWRPVKRLEAELEHAMGRATTPRRLEEGIVEDRSHDDRTWLLQLDFNLRHQWRVLASIGHRARAYTTDVVEDASRHGRRDSRWIHGVEGRWQLARRWRLELDASYMVNDSGRHADGTPPSDFDHDDLSVGAGIVFSHVAKQRKSPAPRPEARSGAR